MYYDGEVNKTVMSFVVVHLQTVKYTVHSSQKLTNTMTAI